ncbi:MAG: N(4)-(beta-N-acetylglucosaminyl)-L-asparaginase [Clostridia bacterium]|nr:N(4)-(beta-N-acetylglucosaminyl)-L-asparaginase [Clostridia bacterium]
MAYAVIGTWKMALEGAELAARMLGEGRAVGDSIVEAVALVEDNPLFDSVGYGGLPNAQGIMELDAAYMDGETLGFGAVMGTHGIRNPIRVAYSLLARRAGCQLCGEGADAYAREKGFVFKNMLAQSAQKRWEEERSNPAASSEDGYADASRAAHDTVCFIGLDSAGRMGVGVSTSGLFMKHPGRVGDSPIIGSGFYCDSRVGGAAATGFGEDILKGCLSFMIVRFMREGLTPMEACHRAVASHLREMTGRGWSRREYAVIAMNARGETGAAGTPDTFPYAVADSCNAAELKCVPAVDYAE